jgi:hypothetical protein
VTITLAVISRSESIPTDGGGVVRVIFELTRHHGKSAGDPIAFNYKLASASTVLERHIKRLPLGTTNLC